MIALARVSVFNLVIEDPKGEGHCDSLVQPSAGRVKKL